MRLGIILISVGILILVLGEISFPLHTSLTVTHHFTSPPWFTSGKIYVNNGTFTVYSDYLIENLTKGQSICLNNFTLIGKGNATVTFSGFKIFYTRNYITFSEIVIILGVVLEILRIIRLRLIR